MLRNKSAEKIICAPFKFFAKYIITGKFLYVLGNVRLEFWGGFMSLLAIAFIVLFLTLARYDIYVMSESEDQESAFFEQWAECSYCTLNPSRVGEVIISTNSFKNSVYIAADKWSGKHVSPTRTTSRFVNLKNDKEFSGVHAYLKVDDNKIYSFKLFALSQHAFDTNLEELIVDYTATHQIFDETAKLSVSYVIRNKNSIRTYMCLEGLHR